MKKVVIFTLLLLVISVMAFAAGTPRGYYQKVVAGNTGIDLRTIVTNTGTTTNANYTVTAQITATGETLTTGITPLASMRMAKLGTAPNDYVVVFVQLGTFPTQWVAGQTVRWVVTYTGAGQYNGQFTTWDEVIPSGTATINLLTPTRNVPPNMPTEAFGVPTLVAPAMDAINVPHGTVTLDWAYATGAGIITPVGYWVKHAPTLVGLATATPMYAPDSFFDVFMSAGADLWWQVAATTDANPGKGSPVATRGKAGSRASGDYSAAWHFSTDNPPTTYNAMIQSNIPGVEIYDGGIATGFTTPHSFSWNVGTSHVVTVQDIPTQVEPAGITVTAAGTYDLNYTNPPNTVGGGVGGTTASTPGAGLVVVPTTAGAAVSGTVQAPGVLVVTVLTPTAKLGSYEGYNHVVQVIQVWASDTAMLDGAPFDFVYTPTTTQYFAFHWGGVANGFYPAPPTAGYAYNGGALHSLGNFDITDAPGTWTYDGALHVAAIPAYAAKGSGTFELILSNGSEDLPVVLSAFNAVATAQMFVNLQWTTESETNNLGFNVLRSTTSNVANAEQVNFGIIAGTNSSTTQTYNFVDNGVAPEATYYYWLEMVNFDGTSNFSNFVMVTTNGATPPPTVPNTTVLRSAYPNPFNLNTSTNIEMDVKNGETATLTIYNVLGQSVKTYVRTAGSHKITWNGRDDNGAVCGSGIYFYKLTSPSVNTTKKMVVVK